VYALITDLQDILDAEPDITLAMETMVNDI